VNEVVSNTRTRLRDLLALISDCEAQREYERNVPIANVPAELVCMWFDDLYHPNPEWITRGFSARELELLAEFDKFYEARHSLLPTDGGVVKLQQSREWIETSQKAKEILSELGWAT